LTVWRDNFGASSGSPVASVPEPAAGFLVILASAVVMSRTKRRRS
jgi:hypothetical protein